MRGNLSGVTPNKLETVQYPSTANKVTKMASVDSSCMAVGKFRFNAPRSPPASPGKKRAMSTKMACCILYLISRLIEGVPAKKLRAKKAMKPEKGTARYRP